MSSPHPPLPSVGFLVHMLYSFMLHISLCVFVRQGVVGNDEPCRLLQDVQTDQRLSHRKADRSGSAHQLNRRGLSATHKGQGSKGFFYDAAFAPLQKRECRSCCMFEHRDVRDCPRKTKWCCLNLCILGYYVILMVDFNESCSVLPY